MVRTASQKRWVQFHIEISYTDSLHLILPFIRVESYSLLNTHVKHAEIQTNYTFTNIVTHIFYLMLLKKSNQVSLQKFLFVLSFIVNNQRRYE